MTGSRASRGRDGEGADRADGDSVDDQERIAQPVGPQDQRQGERRQGVDQVISQQQPAGIAAVGHQPAQRQEQQRRRHESRLRDAYRERVHVQDHGDQPREQHHLDTQRHEPAGEAGEIDRERAGRGLALLQGTSIYIL
jgi:hypothetical protein